MVCSSALFVKSNRFPKQVFLSGEESTELFVIGVVANFNSASRPCVARAYCYVQGFAFLFESDECDRLVVNYWCCINRCECIIFAVFMKCLQLENIVIIILHFDCSFRTVVRKDTVRMYLGWNFGSAYFGEPTALRHSCIVVEILVELGRKKPHGRNWDGFPQGSDV